MPTLKGINAEAGTNFRRWKEVTAVVKEANKPPVKAREVERFNEPKPSPEGPEYPEVTVAHIGVPAREYVPETLATHPDIAKALAEGYSIGDVENGRNAALRMHGRIAAAQHRHGKDAPEVLEAIGEANRVSVMLTTARAAYNRITYPERYA